MKSLTPEEYAILKDLFEKQNSKLRMNVEEIWDRVKKMDNEMDALLKSRYPGYENAIMLLIQFRNFFARYSGMDEIGLPQEVKKLLERMTKEKHLAVYIEGGKVRLFPYVSEVLNDLYGKTKKIKCYHTVTELLQEFVAGKVLAVLGIHNKPGIAIQAHLREELKRLPEFAKDTADTCLLPKCRDLYPPLGLVRMRQAIEEMEHAALKPGQSIKSLKPSTGAQDLTTKMYPLDEEVNVTIIDDTPSEIQGMLAVLQQWPNIVVKVVSQTDAQMPNISVERTHIILLDEQMPGINGTGMAQEFMAQGFKGIIASTSSHIEPDYTKFHFKLKGKMDKDEQAVIEFKKFFNLLLMKYLRLQEKSS
ncbi:hypothetical protein KJ969_00315 [Patescibacteria group bacterium]|nr:hypothetical protein [Patescibacteria group bacterium]MBU1921728.1 hypothetical protein [Patescibacteria group bacterium]